MLSIKAKRNITGILFALGVVCTLFRLWDVIQAPKSGNAWFEFIGILILTFLCFDTFQTYRRRSQNR